jgi:hypothetical protein
MLSPSTIKARGYTERPLTPLGEETGITSAPVSRHPSRASSPLPPVDVPNPYHYQPAVNSSRPEFTVLRRKSSNYAQACGSKFVALAGTDRNNGRSHSTSEETEGITHPPRPRRAYSFSAEDLQSRMNLFNEEN